MSKNAAGMGSVRKRNNRDYIYYEWRGHVEFSNKRKTKVVRIKKSFYGRTKAEALSKKDDYKQTWDHKLDDGVVNLADLEAILTGKQVSNKPLSTADWLNSWWHMANKKATTLESREMNIRTRIIPSIGSIPLEELTKEDIRDMDRKLAKQGLAPNSRRQAWNVLHKALKDAVLDNKIYVSPFDLMPSDWKPVAYQRPGITRILSTSELAQIFPPEPTDPDEKKDWLVDTGLWMLLINHGMRSGEATGITWDCIDWDRGELHIRQTVRTPAKFEKTPKDKGWRLENTTKTGNVRTRSISGRMVEVFMALEQAQELEANDLEAHWETPVTPLTKEQKAEQGIKPRWSNRNPRGFIFTRLLGKPLNPTMTWRRWSNLLKSSNVRHARVHDIRHSFAYERRSKGTDAATLANLMGHANVSTTLSMYGGVSPESKQQAALATDDYVETIIRTAVYKSRGVPMEEGTNGS